VCAFSALRAQALTHMPRRRLQLNLSFFPGAGKTHVQLETSVAELTARALSRVHAGQRLTPRAFLCSILRSLFTLPS
jgi:hypothetical protein